ncbi:unnamed protein product [Rangifer tarandus platyrhynchus]|uniref:Uncharacterized protein n=1 Tax=Rangifer tarandus platyrhynchus TaxID=3082113 RepID=A0AC59ZUS1_RANTA
MFLGKRRAQLLTEHREVKFRAVSCQHSPVRWMEVRRVLASGAHERLCGCLWEWVRLPCSSGEKAPSWEWMRPASRGLWVLWGRSQQVRGLVLPELLGRCGKGLILVGNWCLLE